MGTPTDPAPEALRSFVDGLGAVLDRARTEQAILAEARPLLARLVAGDDWLPAAHAAADPRRYRQHLLHLDPRSRFSVVSFVWGPGQATPIHDHTVWGLIGVLRGGEISHRYERGDGGLRRTGVDRLEAGQVEAVSPAIGDIHEVRNAFDDRVSISIHAYGADIGALTRSTYDMTGRRRPFVSRYSSTTPIPL